MEMGDYFIRTRISKTRVARFSYPGFGTFAKRLRPARRGRNPRTGEEMQIAPQETISFVPSKELKSLVNQHLQSAAAKSGSKEGGSPYWGEQST